MDTPFQTAEQFINNQINEVLEKSKEYRRSRNKNGETEPKGRVSGFIKDV
jgi:hypothetical protein